MPSTWCIKKTECRERKWKTREPVVVVKECDHSEQSSSRPKNDSSLEEAKIDIGEIKKSSGPTFRTSVYRNETCRSILNSVFYPLIDYTGHSSQRWIKLCKECSKPDQDAQKEFSLFN